jgi:hypothetical protein
MSRIDKAACQLRFVTFRRLAESNSVGRKASFIYNQLFCLT